MSNTQKKLRPSQQKAHQICQDAQIREYCINVEMMVYDLKNPVPGGFCNSTSTMILGDAIAFLIEMQGNFLRMPEIDSKFLLSLRKRGSKQMTITRKENKKTFKVVLKATSIHMKDWSRMQELIWKREQS